jgi:hypothetical protein
VKPRFLRQKPNVLALAALLLAACSTIQSVQAPALPPAPAPVLDLPHPQGFGMNELKALFLDPKAPERSQIATCADTFLALSRRTELREEVRAGARELVLEKPVMHHWCFYSKLLELDEGLRKAKLLDERQQLTLQTFSYAIATARAFQLEFRDSRYLRWAIQRYRALSPVVFQRRVELTPEATAELAVIENPFGIWKPIPDRQSILQKYGLREEPARAAGSEPARMPASVPAPAPASAPPASELSDDEVSQIFEELEQK